MNKLNWNEIHARIIFHTCTKNYNVTVRFQHRKKEGKKTLKNQQNAGQKVVSKEVNAKKQPAFSLSISNLDFYAWTSQRTELSFSTTKTARKMSIDHTHALFIMNFHSFQMRVNKPFKAFNLHHKQGLTFHWTIFNKD